MKAIILGLVIALLLMGAGYRFHLSQYEEVCTQYQVNVTAELVRCYDYPSWHCTNSTGVFGRWTHCIPNYDNMTEECYYNHDYIQTDNCIEYKLVRRTNIEPFIFLFDWCELYPNSEDCK